MSELSLIAYLKAMCDEFEKVGFKNGKGDDNFLWGFQTAIAVAKRFESGEREKPRLMKCPYHQRYRPRDTNAAFFQERPEREYDEYYCGCKGWD